MVEIEVMLTVGQTLSAVGYLAGREGGKVTIGQVRTEERKGDSERERERETVLLRRAHLYATCCVLASLIRSKFNYARHYV